MKSPRRAAVFAFGVASSVTSMIGLALIAVAIALVAVADAWLWAILVGVAGTVLAGAGVVAVLAAAVVGATARERIHANARTAVGHDEDRPPQDGDRSFRGSED